jgi:CDP-diacylglycerol---serine O-phosphatidyltransferase
MANTIKAFIPNALTLCNLACGFFILLINDINTVVTLFCLSLLFDVFDGLIARKLKINSALGIQLDSLADVVSFGVVPAFLYFKMAPDSSVLSYLAPCLIVVASGYRLAKFNLLPSSNFFVGLNTPSNAIFFLGIYLAFQNDSVLIKNLLSNSWVYLLIPLVFAYLLNSPLKMFSLKSIGKSMKDNVYHLTLIGIVVLLIVIDPILAISGSVLGYLALSFVMNVFGNTDNA